MKKFDEQAMISGLCEREQDARDLRKLFDPNWLKDAELKPVLRAIFDYIDEESSVPSLNSLSQYMEDKDKAKFDARWGTTLAQLRGYDNKTQTYAINRAKEAAAAYSLHYLMHEQRFQQMLDTGNAEGLRREVSHWLGRHTESEDEGLFSIQEAFDKLLSDHPWQGKMKKVPTGIKAIDEWVGGLRAPQMGIIMAPTGHGKSALLMNIALTAAAIEGKQVLFITNELTTNEQSERFMVRLQNPHDDGGRFKFFSLGEIQEDPTLAYKQFKGYQNELNKKLYIYSANLGQDVAGIEEVCQRVRNERGVWPAVIIVDYLERMSTKVRMDRGQTWTYFGQIAKELVWLAKRRNCVIWTAVQTNRSGMNIKTDLGMESAQGSIQHFQESSFAVGVRKVQVTTGDNEVKSCLEFQEMKARHGAMEGRKMVLECDLGRMWISENEVKSIKEIEEDDASTSKKGSKKPSLGGQRRTKGKGP